MNRSLSPIPTWYRRAWGFTLLELMAVVILVGILAVIAIPGASQAMRERRSSRAAHEVAALYNQARTRAIARGSAVLVRWNLSDGGFEIREAIAGSAGGNCHLAPIASCTVPTSRWNDGDLGNQLLMAFKPLGTTTYSMVNMEYKETSLNAAGAVASSERPQVDICMTPGGRVFYRSSNSESDAFTVLSGNHSIRVWMQSGSNIIGIERHIFILPNGTARVGI